MKKIFIFLITITILILSTVNIFGASVTPQTFPGNDSNPNDFTPPEGCIHYEIPNSGTPGTYTVKFNNNGEVDPNGTNIFTVVVGTKTGNDFTQVLSWSSNFPIYAVIVKGGNAFNLYQYPDSVRADTDLVSPNNPSGHPADVSHVSVVICPSEDTSGTDTSDTGTDTTCPDTKKDCKCVFICKCDQSNGNSAILAIVIAALIAAFFIIGIIIGKNHKHDHKHHC